jgi:hypothetical protein
MLRKLIHPILAGVFAAFVTFIYGLIYEKAMAIEELEMESLREAIPTFHLFLVPLLVCLIASFAYFLLRKLDSKWGSFLFYFLFASFSIATSFGVLMINNLYGDLEFTINGYAMPMHYFPFLSWVAFKPLFFSESK